ncbi:MAG: isoleucine--tRNA ligase [Bacteroidetes bacterium]|nr:isoleucine--tRNA ligase [Bacteroidota bacterium]
MSTFQPFAEKFTYAELEEEILAYWREHDIFQKSIDDRAGAKSFTFYEGPPSVNGKPGIHHVMARTLKDMICRYKTVTGHQVMRKAGWDTHGLPIEVALEKELKFEQKSDIEKFGVAKFNQKAKDFVYHHIEYPEGWQKLTERMGYWINLEEAYITCTNDYIESVWWALSEFYKKGLIYKGFKIVPQCPHCETPLSSHELALGYADVQDMNVYVKFKCADEDANILVWTTTPWTLISNVALAVHPDVEYVKIRTADHGILYLAKARLGIISEEYELLAELKGSDLLGMKYERLFDYVPVDKKAFYVVAGDFVTTEDGSGVVHIAPAFGVDDYEMMKKYDLPFVLPVTTSGRFTEEVTDFAGRLVKTLQFATHKEDGVDPEIIRMLKERGRIYRSSKDYMHSYPHCWRCDNPLIYYARDSWYIRTTDYAQRMIELNREINWCPPEVGSGRFGNWLEDNKDWSLSRDRYWGTPLPIWIAEDGSDMFIVGSIDELLEGFRLVDGERVAPTRDDIDLHKPWVDDILFEKNGLLYKRTPELIDVWFDSGAMPFAQYHYPFENRKVFEANFPADFICEGIDQTRGWFYTLHAISSALFDKPAFKNLIVNELVLDKNGQKMSKSKGNVVDPFVVLETYGADATRWYLTVGSPPWRQTMFNEKDIEGVQRNFFRALINTYQFFALYANIDGYTGTEEQIPLEQRPEIDQWILTELNVLIRDVRKSMDAYDVTPAARAITEFTVDQLSNWYVRRNRRRFWKGLMSSDKLAAYQTLHTCMLTIAQLMSPVAPFLSEHLYQRLTVNLTAKAESVHLALLPDAGTIDDTLKERMHTAQRVVYLARGLREQARIKTRQPLSRILVATTSAVIVEHVRAMKGVIIEETNVKDIEFIANDSEMLRKKAKPNFKSIGPKFGKLVKAITTRVNAFTLDEINQVEADGTMMLEIEGETVTLALEDIEIQHEDIEGWTIGADNDLVVALDTVLSDELLDEGTAREFVSKIQSLRKDSGFSVTDRIVITFDSTDERLIRAILRMESYICAETLAEKIVRATIPDGSGSQMDVNDFTCNVYITTTIAD